MKGQTFLLKYVRETLKSVFLEGRYADHAVQFALKTHPKWGSRDRRFFAETAYDLVRWWRLYWDSCGFKSSDQAFESDESLDRILNLYMDIGPKDLSKKRRAEGAKFGVFASYPDDLIEDFSKELGQKEAFEILEAMNRHADVYLRVNTLKTSKQEVLRELTDLGYKLEELTLDFEGASDTCLKLLERKNVFMTETFRKGWFEVQDVSSQQIAPFLGSKPGEFIIDACAGAGGKTLHLASLMANKGRLLAMDVHEKKLTQLKERARRAGVSLLNIKLIENSKTIKRYKGKADGLLLDVPCSGSGVIARNPDTKWKWARQASVEMLELQRQILRDYSEVVRPGGRMVYSTCSVLPRENQRQVKLFIETNPHWELKAERFFDPTRHEGDGFYAALMIRSGA